MKNAATAKAVDLGIKRNCPKCGAKFYDFRKPEIECPKCGTEIDPNATTKPTFPKAAPEAKRAPVDEDDAPVVRDDDAGAFEDVEDLSDEEEVTDVGANDDDDEDES